jgi:hypothetical protein
MSGLLELAERVEKATGPDRELDAAIGSMLYQMKVDREVPGIEGCCHEPVTSSLDAAMTLVPEGWFFTAGRRDKNRCRAHVNNGESHFIGVAARPNPAKQWFECLGDTPALALCAAALRALAHQTAEERDNG